MSEAFSTIEVAPGERVDFWREMVRRHFVPLHVQPLAEDDFDGTVNLRSIGELHTARVRAHPMLATRTRKHIARSSSDEYFIALHLGGVARAEQDGHVALLRPGDFALLDSARPYSIAFRAAGSFEHFILRVPRDQLDARVARLDRATALAVKANSTAGRLATPAIATLATADVAAQFVDPILDLIATAVAEAAGLYAPAVSDRQRTLDQIKRYALAHIAEHDLSPPRVAAACHVSPRQLHRLFEHQNITFRRFVKETRLRRIQRDLADPRLEALTIAEIGRNHGYNDASVLTRDFTQRYGTGPRAFRQANA